jgi:hypothetical protein
MSERMYSKINRGGEVTKPIMTKDMTLTFTIVAIVTIASLITVGFVNMAYTSGHYSKAYQLCKDSILTNERMGAYPSLKAFNVVLKTCEGATAAY